MIFWPFVPPPSYGCFRRAKAIGLPLLVFFFFFKKKESLWRNEFRSPVVATLRNWADIGTGALEKGGLDSVVRQMPLRQEAWQLKMTVVVAAHSFRPKL